MRALCLLVELEYGDDDFCGGRKIGEPGENPRSKPRTNNKVNPHMTPSRNRTWATFVGGERSYHCAIHASHAPH